MDRAEKIGVLEYHYNLKSHSAKEIVKALEGGLPVFAVDTEMSGNDDCIIMDRDEDEGDVETLFVHHFDLEEFPSTWTVSRVSLSIFE